MIVLDFFSIIFLGPFWAKMALKYTLSVEIFACRKFREFFEPPKNCISRVEIFANHARKNLFFVHFGPNLAKYASKALFTCRNFSRIFKKFAKFVKFTKFSARENFYTQGTLDTPSYLIRAKTIPSSYFL